MLSEWFVISLCLIRSLILVHYHYINLRNVINQTQELIRRWLYFFAVQLVREDRTDKREENVVQWTSDWKSIFILYSFQREVQSRELNDPKRQIIANLTFRRKHSQTWYSFWWQIGTSTCLPLLRRSVFTIGDNTQSSALKYCSYFIETNSSQFVIFNAN